MIDTVSAMTGVATDAGRFAEAYGTHWAPLQRRALALSRDTSIADDITQEAFVRLLIVSREGWWPENLGGWLNRVATNLSISRGRGRAVAARVMVGTAMEQPNINRCAMESPEAIALDRDQLRSTLLAFGTLDADAQTALRLAGRGYSATAIGIQIDRSEGATRTLIYRARAALRARADVGPSLVSTAGTSR